jgi:hypothetical protein
MGSDSFYLTFDSSHPLDAKIEPRKAVRHNYIIALCLAIKYATGPFCPTHVFPGPKLQILWTAPSINAECSPPWPYSYNNISLSRRGTSVRRFRCSGLRSRYIRRTHLYPFCFSIRSISFRTTLLFFLGFHSCFFLRLSPCFFIFALVFLSQSFGFEFMPVAF